MAATITNTTTIARALLAQFENFYTPNWDAFDKEYSKWNTLIGKDTPTGLYDTFGNLPAAKEMTDGASFENNAISQAYQTSITVKQFGTTLALTYMAQKYAQNNSNIIDKMKVASTAKSMLVTLEENGITPWNGAFTVNLADGVPLISASHPCKDTADTVYSNLATGVLSYENLEAGVKLFAGFKDHQGKPVPSRPTAIKTHALNEMAVKKLFESQYVPIDNQLVNRALPNLTPIFSNYITSKTAWFLEEIAADRPHVISQYLNSCPSPENSVDVFPENRNYVASSAFFMNSGAIPNVGIVGSTGVVETGGE